MKCSECTHLAWKEILKKRLLYMSDVLQGTYKGENEPEIVSRILVCRAKNDEEKNKNETKLDIFCQNFKE